MGYLGMTVLLSALGFSFGCAPSIQVRGHSYIRAERQEAQPHSGMCGALMGITPLTPDLSGVAGSVSCFGFFLSVVVVPVCSPDRFLVLGTSGSQVLDVL